MRLDIVTSTACNEKGLLLFLFSKHGGTLMVGVKRPEGLPDFRDPPLNEVVLGVQFAPPPGYQQIFAGEVWKLFKSHYPKVSEQPPLAPIFETFGPPGAQQMPFNLAMGFPHPRYWFLSADDRELIQFQSDRMLHNWRQVAGAEQVEYPRFETLIGKFQKELLQLEDYFRTLSQKALVCNQAEISYINHIVFREDHELSEILKIAKFEKRPSDFSISWRNTLFRRDGAPYARLIGDAVSGYTLQGEEMLALTLTVRGNPLVGTVGNIMEFLRSGRESIVNEFANITTDAAHEIWGRTQ